MEKVKDPDREFLRYIHAFRGFAILAVVATHVMTTLDWTRDNLIHERAIHAVIRSAVTRKRIAYQRPSSKLT